MRALSSSSRIRERAAEDQLRLMAEWQSTKIGKWGAPLTRVSVEQERRSLILRFQTDEHSAGSAGFIQWANDFRRQLVRDYCASDYGTQSRKTDISHVWVMRYASTEMVEAVVLSDDQCKK